MHLVPSHMQVVPVGKGLQSILIKIKKPKDIKTGEKCSLTLKITGYVDDGEGYVGDNGIIYGGEDVIESNDIIVIENS